MADQAKEPSFHGKWAAKPNSRKGELIFNVRGRSLVIYQLLLAATELKSLMRMARLFKSAAYRRLSIWSQQPDLREGRLC